jgi:hypothetical protein
MSLPDEISHCSDGKTVIHDRWGKGIISGYIVVFKNQIMYTTYPKTFCKGTLTVE